MGILRKLFSSPEPIKPSVGPTLMAKMLADSVCEALENSERENDSDNSIERIEGNLFILSVFDCMFLHYNAPLETRAKMAKIFREKTLCLHGDPQLMENRRSYYFDLINKFIETHPSISGSNHAEFDESLDRLKCAYLKRVPSSNGAVFSAQLLFCQKTFTSLLKTYSVL